MFKRIISAVTLVFVLLNTVSCSTENYPLYTEDLADYNTEKFPNYSSTLPEKIPENAQVVAYSNYNYWNEIRDIYLELKFSQKTELENYLVNLYDGIIESQAKRGTQITELDEYIVEDKNPYDSTFIDRFFTRYPTYSGDRAFVGYKVKKTESNTRYQCDYEIISYSVEKLTVIHAVGEGSYIKGRTMEPKYFTRFAVPTDEPFERCYYLSR